MLNTIQFQVKHFSTVLALTSLCIVFVVLKYVELIELIVYLLIIIKIYLKCFY